MGELHDDHAHALRRAQPRTSTEATIVEAARTEYWRRYAGARMAVPDTVLAEVSRTNHRLGALYGSLVRISHGTARLGDDLQASFATVGAAGDGLAVLRHAMRTGPGTADAAGPAGE